MPDRVNRPRALATPLVARLASALMLSLMACDDPSSGALSRWNAIDRDSESPGTYWFEEHSCAALFGGCGEASVFQVTDGEPVLVGRRRVGRETCDGLDRYGRIDPRATFPELIASCPSNANVEFDDAGVMVDCRYREPNCFDSCDYGFSIVRYGHGEFVGDATTDEACVY